MEQRIIEQIVDEVIKRLHGFGEVPMVPIGISNRHIHVSQDDLEILFGEGYSLTKLKDLKQPGQYAANETVTVIGPKGKFENVRILGPVRPETQLEISLSDGFKLGINPPVRESGEISQTPAFTIAGPKGKVQKSQGVIAALRHIHMPKNYAEHFGFRDKDTVCVEIDGQRKVVYHNVLLRVSDQFELEMHLDMDEANAGGIKNEDKARIIKD